MQPVSVSFNGDLRVQFLIDGTPDASAAHSEKAGKRWPIDDESGE